MASRWPPPASRQEPFDRCGSPAAASEGDTPSRSSAAAASCGTACASKRASPIGAGRTAVVGVVAGWIAAGALAGSAVAAAVGRPICR